MQFDLYTRFVTTAFENQEESIYNQRLRKHKLARDKLDFWMALDLLDDKLENQNRLS